VSFVASFYKNGPTKDGQSGRTLRCWEAPASLAKRGGCTQLRQSDQNQQHPTKVWAEPRPSAFESAGQESNLVNHVLRTGSRVYFKRPTKFWSETYGALPLSYSATLGLRWWDSNPRPPAYKACTPNRQSVCFHWPGDEGLVRRIALPLSYTHHRINRVGDRTRTDNRCTPTGSRRSKSQFSKETANEENGSDATFNRCSPNRQLAVRDAGGNRTHL
jgi:hypothetical protein